MMPRKMTVYLAAPPGDGLRSAREHFHLYVKPVLVAAAMDWDVIEGRKEGDVRYKTAERIRKKRKRAGEGEPPTEEEAEVITVEGLRESKGIVDYDGVAGDIVVGRNTWKEYVRGLHEGWLGPVDPPKPPQADQPQETETSKHTPGQSSFGDMAVKAAVNSVKPPTKPESEFVPDDAGKESSTSSSDDASPQEPAAEEKKKEEDEKPKPRQPPPYIQPSEYQSATASSNLPDIIGPSVAARYPHILGFRNTPIRIYRFLTRRYLADSIGQQVAAAVLASYRPYMTESSGDDESLASESEVTKVLQHEEKDWWKTTFYPRKEHEESVWIEDMTLDERVVGRMRAFQLTAEDEDRAKRLGEGKEKVTKDDEGS
jgi:import inner membrane translocase subunit TIM54